MKPQSAASVYHEATFENAPPIKIIRMLYQGALRFLERASQADPSDPSSDFIDALSRAEQIVVELRLSLDAIEAPDIVTALEGLYIFVEERLQTAMNERSHEPLEGTREVLRNLLEAWSAVDLQEGAGA